jgi:hypothetical protein
VVATWWPMLGPAPRIRRTGDGDDMVLGRRMEGGGFEGLRDLGNLASRGYKVCAVRVTREAGRVMTEVSWQRRCRCRYS